MKCPICKGEKKTKFYSIDVRDSKVVKIEHTLKCLTCKGTGEVPQPAADPWEKITEDMTNLPKDGSDVLLGDAKTFAVAACFNGRCWADYRDVEIEWDEYFTHFTRINLPEGSE